MKTLIAFVLLLAAVPANQPRQIKWSGYTWNVRDSRGLPDEPEDNVWDASTQTVWVDAAGRLHLRVRHTDKGWVSAEVELDRQLGYGTYTIDVQGGTLDYQHGVFGFYTFDRKETARTGEKSEIDIEFSRWGWSDIATKDGKPDTEHPTLQYMVQPDKVGEGLFDVNAEPSTHTFGWARGKVDFRYMTATRQFYLGAGASHVPTAGTVRIDLWHCTPCQGDPVREFEVVLNAFRFAR